MPLLPLSNVMLEQPVEHAVPNNQDIPTDEMDIFFRSEDEFLPEGKTWADLTEKELAEVRAKYRFDPMRPGMYQGITGLGPMM